MIQCYMPQFSGRHRSCLRPRPACILSIATPSLAVAQCSHITISFTDCLPFSHDLKIVSEPSLTCGIRPTDLSRGRVIFYRVELRSLHVFVQKFTVRRLVDLRGGASVFTSCDIDSGPLPPD